MRSIAIPPLVWDGRMRIRKPQDADKSHNIDMKVTMIRCLPFTRRIQNDTLYNVVGGKGERKADSGLFRNQNSHECDKA